MQCLDLHFLSLSHPYPSVGAQNPTTGEVLASGSQDTPWPWLSSRNYSPHLPRGYLSISGDIFSCHNLGMLLASNG